MMNSNDYWQDRLEEIRDQNFKERKLKKMYHDSFKRMKKEIEALYYRMDAGQHITRSELYKFSHFLSMKKAVKEECDLNTVRLKAHMEEALKRAYKNTFKTTQHFFHNKTPWALVNDKRLESILSTNWSGKHFSSRIWKNQRQLSKDIEETIIDCIVTGKSKAEAIHRIQLRNFVSYNKAENLVRTEMSHVVNKACLDTYKQNGCNEVKVLSERKKRTCDFCKSKHGVTVPIKGAKTGVDIPPFHPRCYCDIAPIVKIERN